ncbi:hypothetical protein KCU91_g94, partial [Aureobasidium melanogenum]
MPDRAFLASSESTLASWARAAVKYTSLMLNLMNCAWYWSKRSTSPLLALKSFSPGSVTRVFNLCDLEIDKLSPCQPTKQYLRNGIVDQRSTIDIWTAQHKCMFRNLWCILICRCPRPIKVIFNITDRLDHLGRKSSFMGGSKVDRNWWGDDAVSRNVVESSEGLIKKVKVENKVFVSHFISVCGSVFPSVVVEVGAEFGTIAVVIGVNKQALAVGEVLGRQRRHDKNTIFKCTPCHSREVQ